MILPQSVEVIEVGPRDGYQNIKEWIPTETKLKIIDALVAAGFQHMEVASFVHPKAIPQMADAADVLSAVKARYPDLTTIALAPNLYGARKAIELGVKQITFVISASERHNLENTKQTHEQSIAAFQQVVKIKGDVSIRLGIATSFDCPFTGRVPVQKVMQLVEAGLEAGADGIYFADTVGSANPVQVEEFLEIIQAKYPVLPITLHLHDTCGMGLANVMVALRMGVRRFETAIGGLGGCPFAPGAAGNIATEDLVNMLHQMGVATGLDFERLMLATRLTQNSLPVQLTGHMVRKAAVSKNCSLDSFNN